MKASHTLTPVFDEPNLVATAGLVPALALADRSGLTDLLDGRVTVPSPNRTGKIRSVIAGMLAGADDIDGLDVLRSGGTHRVLPGVRAPSTLGTFLRGFFHGHVLQLAAVNRGLLTGLTRDNPGLLGADGPVLVDLDDTIREVHGYQKQPAAYGYSGVRGLNGLVATVSTDTTPPLLTDFGLRRGNVRSGDSAGWYAARTLTTVAAMAPGRQALTRADSAFCTYDTVRAITTAGAWFSLTIPAWPTVTRALAAIADQDWQPIKYPRAVFDEEAGRWVSEAEVAETPFTAFTSRKKSERVTCRLVVRRVKRLNQTAARAGQDELFATYRYHAFITNSTLDTVAADRRHRGHAIVEQTIAELKNGPLAHLPSGHFSANAAWLACAVLAFNISRAAAHAAGMPRSRLPTVRDRLLRVPARLAAHARSMTAHLPRAWPWQHQWQRLWQTANSPPLAASP